MLQTYARLFENLSLGILVADDDAFYVDANLAACELFGRTRSEILGHHLSEFIEGARQEEVDVQWRAFLRDGIQQGRFNIQLPRGESQPISFHAQANFAPGLHCSFITAAPRELPAEGNLIALCAWTKRVRVGDRWLPLEEYFEQVHGLTVTHGICPEAFSAIRRSQVNRG